MTNPWAIDDSIANFNTRRASRNFSTAPHWPFAMLGLGYVALVLASLAAWVTHVIVCIKASAWILLLFGCLVAPVGVVHGFGIWLGVF